MSVARTIALFRNDIGAMIKDAKNKGKDAAEIDFRLNFVWKISLADWNAAQN